VVEIYVYRSSACATKAGRFLRSGGDCTNIGKGAARTVFRFVRTMTVLYMALKSLAGSVDRLQNNELSRSS
jgi:hypothetical protein